MQRKLCVPLACAKKTLLTICMCKENLAYHKHLQRFKASTIIHMIIWLHHICKDSKRRPHSEIAPYLQSISCNQASIVMVQPLVDAPRIMMSYMQSGTQICSYCYHETFFEIEKWKILLNAVARWDLLSDIYNHVTGCYKPAVLNHATTKTNYAWEILQVR